MKQFILCSLLGAGIGAVAGLLTAPAAQMPTSALAGAIIGLLVGLSFGLLMYRHRAVIAAARRDPEEAQRRARLRQQRRETAEEIVMENKLRGGGDISSLGDF